MQLLLDGYNILKKIKKTAYITDVERQKFIKQLNNYVHKKKLSIIVVFDGGPDNWPTVTKINNYLAIVYSGIRDTADDYIKKYIDSHKGNEILLVSSDRELVMYARQYSIPSLDSYDFSQFLFDMQTIEPTKKTNHQTAQKLTTLTHKELDTLMEQLNVSKIKKEPEPSTKKIKSKKLPKEERKLLQKLKKL